MRGQAERKEAHAKTRVASNDVAIEAPGVPAGFGRSRGDATGVFARAASD